MFSQGAQSTRVLNHKGDLLSFQFSHTLASRGESQGELELKLTKMSFQREAKAFSIKTEGTTVIKTISTDVDFVDCASVVDEDIGLTVPCVLLKQCKKKRTSFKYLLFTLSQSNSLSHHLEFKLPYEIKDNLTFLHGPTVLWSHAGNVNYASLSVGEVKQVPLQLSSVLFIGEVPLDKREIIVLGKSSLERPTDPRQDVWGHMSLGYLLDYGKSFDGACFLPHAYISVAKCILIVSAEEDDSGLKSTVVVVTSRNQLMWFEAGVPKDVCMLPFAEPLNVQMANTGRNGCLFVVSFSHGNVCTVWKDSFQVASCWQGVCSLLVDDFVGCGTDQVLLLFDNHRSLGTTLTNFIITDLGDITYTDRPEGNEGLDATDPVQENQLLTVQALESRLQSGMSSIQELQRDLVVTERVIRQSARALTDLVSGSEHTLSSPEEEDLVSLWDEDGEEEDLLEEMPTKPVAPPAAPPVLVEKVWHRVIEDHLVVGVQISADAASSLESASVSFLIEAGQGVAPPVIQATSRSFRLPQPPPPSPPPPPPPSPSRSPSCPEPPAKRKKPDQTSGMGSDGALTLTATAVTELIPLLACAEFRCHILLHSVQRQETAAPQRAGGPAVTHCGSVSLDIQDVACGKLTPRLLKDRTIITAEATEDLLSLLAVSDSWRFLISCPDHTLFAVPQWLLGALRCERAAVQPDFILSNPENPSTMMLFHWRERNSFQGELLVYCRAQHHLLQFLDSLCRRLPPSHLIDVLCPTAGQDPAQALASSLERELLAMREGVTSLLRSATSGEGRDGKEREEGATDPTPSSSADAADELQRHRAEWCRERERSRRMLSPLVDVEQYRKFTDALANIQLETDVTAYALCEAWPVSPVPQPHSSMPAAPNSKS
ncbi:hypothetical protein AAFF_G00008110 [Aldrovandia affinis]|uniref:Fanconi anemia group B protein n=1 Tax=Aldrovandia affinis TaxID=143900 RepID=A0AAD7T6Y7_9TELE|nr:hypothetical protein AAFF_G00008110 [Aldrovandia affinis]